MKNLFNKATQILLPVFTILGFMFTSFKRPDLGLIFNLISEIFWLYSGYVAWKKANQFGIFLTTLIITAIVLYGVINYWFIH